MADLISMLAAAAGAGGEAGYQIERSLRFNSADSAYLSRTPASAGNRRTFTWSGWVKRTKLGTAQNLFLGNPSTDPYFIFNFNSTDVLRVLAVDSTQSPVDPQYLTSAVFRDLSAWYHIVLAVDTTASSGNRVKVYVNGESQSLTISTEFGLNWQTQINTTTQHRIGRWLDISSLYTDAYITDVHFVDGQALTPSDFGETDATTGVWKPKAYAGTYGTNGFRLDFSDNTSTTTIGYDAAGSNDWTANNFSVAAGANNDSLVDTPTPYGDDTGAGGEVRGNYCTLNPLGLAGATPVNGNLAVSASGTVGNRISTFFVTSGKWYWEGSGEGYVGTIIGSAGAAFTGSVSAAGSNAIGYWEGGLAYWDGGFTATGTSYTSGDVIGVALDMDAGNVKFYKNNTLIHDLTFGSGTIPDLSAGVYPGYNVGGTVGTRSVNLNFGQRPFAYTAPSGYKALCTQNLAEGTITTSGTFTGNGSTNGPFVYLNGVPTAMTIDGNAVTFGTHADKLANGFKVRSSSASYNANATSMSYTISTTGAKFKYANAQPNP